MEKKIPQIRFNGFTDNWKQSKLSELLTQRIEHQTITDAAPLLAFSYAEGVINPEDKKSNKRDFIMIDKYNKIFSRTELDDIIYNPANVIHGAIHRNKLGTGVVSPIYKIFKCNDNVSPKYMGERLHTNKFIGKIFKYIEGTVIKLRTLSPEKFIEMKIEIPKKVEEQEQIGEFFNNIDKLIATNEQKLEKLKNIKSALLDKMFPQNNETIPKIRFKGFSYDWEKYKLGNIGTTYTGLSGKNKDDFGHGSANYITYMNIFKNPIADADEIEKVEIDNAQNTVKYGDVFFTTSSETPEEVGMSSVWLGNKQNLYLNSFCFGYRFNDNTNIDYTFIAYMLRSKTTRKSLELLAQGISRYNISKNKVMDIYIDAPQKTEQKKIGNLFKNIDKLITLTEKKIEKLKNIKSGLLEKMFV